MKKIFGISLLRKTPSRLATFSRDDYILASVFLAAIATALLFGYDGYLFYQDIIDRSRRAPVTPMFKAFSEKDLDEIVTLLDEREKKFSEILSEK